MCAYNSFSNRVAVKLAKALAAATHARFMFCVDEGQYDRKNCSRNLLCGPNWIEITDEGQ